MLDTKAVRVLMAQNEIYRQDELAVRLGRTDGFVSQMLNGISNPGPETREKLCEILNCTEDDILLDEGKAQALTPT